MLIFNIKKYVEDRPKIWRVAWKILQSSNLFLPHDPTYYSLKHLLVDKNSLILDIGANQGISALSFRKLCKENKIISFEPNSSLELDLSQTCSRISNFKYHMCGLGAEKGEFNLYVPLYKDIYLHTFSSFDYISLLHAINKSYNKKIKSSIRIKVLKCKVETLDSFNLNPSVIKIDAEGFEEKILQGAQNTLRCYLPSIIFEAVHGSIDSIISQLNYYDYQIYRFDPKKDKFIEYNSSDLVAHNSGTRNLIAIPPLIREKLHNEFKIEY